VDGAVLLELAEEIFDEVARLVGVFVEIALNLAAALGRDHERLSPCQQRIAHPLVGIKGLVRQQDLGRHLTIRPRWMSSPALVGGSPYVEDVQVGSDRQQPASDGGFRFTVNVTTRKLFTRLAHCFLPLANLDNGVLERLGR
jgi:hypothetical protein